MKRLKDGEAQNVKPHWLRSLASCLRLLIALLNVCWIICVASTVTVWVSFLQDLHLFAKNWQNPKLVLPAWGCSYEFWKPWKSWLFWVQAKQLTHPVAGCWESLPTMVSRGFKQLNRDELPCKRAQLYRWRKPWIASRLTKEFQVTWNLDGVQNVQIKFNG